MNQKESLANLHAALGHGNLNRSWAKLEIVLGLAAVSTAVFLGTWAVSRSEVQWGTAVAGWLLFILGGYLAMAGNRSHLYQSNNELTAYLASRIDGREERAMQS